MGQDATATLSEIEAARQRLQHDVDVLEARLRPGSDLREQAMAMGGVAAAAGVGLLVAAGVTRRRLRRRAAQRHARLQADAVADVLEARGLMPLRTPGDERIATPAPASSTLALSAALAALAALGASIVRYVARRQIHPEGCPHRSAGATTTIMAGPT